MAERCKSGKGQKITAALYNNYYRGERRGRGDWNIKLIKLQLTEEKKTNPEINPKHI